MAASGVRAESCDSSCPVCELCGTFQNLLLCAGCKEAYYCGKAHQKDHWKKHKHICAGKKRGKYLVERNSSEPRENSQNLQVPDGKSIVERNHDKTSDGTHLPESRTDTVRCTDLPNECKVWSRQYEQLSVESRVDNKAIIEKVDESKSTCDTDSPSYRNKADTCVGREATPLSGNGNTLTDKTENTFSQYPVPSTCTAARPMPIPYTGHPCMDTPKPVDQHQTGTTNSEHTPQKETKLADYVVKCLNDYGICVVDHFMGAAKGHEIYQEVLNLQQMGVFLDGQLVSKTGSTKKIRGDKITWVEKGNAGIHHIGSLIHRLDTLIMTCNGRLDNHNINGRTKVCLTIICAVCIITS